MEFPSKIKSSGIALALSVCMTLPFTTATAQESRHLSLPDAIQLSLDNSKELKISKAKILQASAELSEAKNRQLPDVKISGSYLRLTQPTIDLKVPLNSGENGGSGESQAIKVDQAMYGIANVTMPLFSGLRIRSGIESAKYLQKAAELDAQKDKEELIQTTVAAYYNLYKAKAAVDLVEENKKNAAQRVLDFGNLEKNGLLARNDYLKAQLQESNVELALLDAQNNEKIATFNLNLMLGIPENTELALDDSIATLPQIKSMEEWENAALSHRADYLALQQREAATAAGVKAAKGEYYPGIAITGGYVAADIPKFITITNAVNIGVGLSYDLSSLYKTGAKVRQAKARQEQMHWAGAQMNDGIRMQVHQSYQNYLESIKKIEVYKKAVEQANENYRITKNKYDNSLATTTDLLDADVAKLQANINYEYARADAAVAYNKLHETAGILAGKE